MMLFNSLQVVFQLLFLTSVYAGSVVKDFHKAPRGWTKVARAPGNYVLNLRIGLTQGNFAELHRQLYEVSDPQHVRYGQHLSVDQVNELVRPLPPTVEAIEAWLSKSGVKSENLKYNPSHSWISFPLSVAEAEVLLNAEYSIWEHEGGSTLVRTEFWSLPEELHDHITTIQPTNSWARLQQKVPVREIAYLKEKKKESHVSWGPWSASQPSHTGGWGPSKSHSASSTAPPGPTATFAANPADVAAACNFSSVTPNCLRVLYGTINYTPVSNGKSQLGITNYLEEYQNRSDIYQFLSINRPEAAQYALQLAQISVAGGVIDNGTNTADADTGLEGNLDAEYMIGIGYPLPLTTWGTGGRDPSFMPDLVTPDNFDEPFLTWADYILTQKDIPQVISTSYGDDEQTISPSYAAAVCNEFAQLGARGVSLLFSSGDDGVGMNGSCYSNVDNTTYEFLPTFPATCQYVTVVGGTTNFPEVAMYAQSLLSSNIYASGGGFSNYFQTANYQKNAVGKDVAGLNGLYDGFYNKSGRAYPDIACIAQRFPTIWNGTGTRLVGTSGSSPICAAVLGLVNDALIAAGRPPLGFLNPWLYSGGYNGFTDVTNGSALGCDVAGFPAAKGWDAVTGFGSPYFARVLKVLGLQDSFR